jgi:hypothetical protein
MSLSLGFLGCMTTTYLARYTTAPQSPASRQWSNDTISVVTELSGYAFRFHMTNLLDKPIRINWTDASLVIKGDAFGVVRATHDANLDGGYSLLLQPGSSRTESMVARDNLFLSSDDSQENRVLPLHSTSPADSSAWRGALVDFYLPIMVDRIERTYKFTWIVEKVEYLRYENR